MSGLPKKTTGNLTRARKLLLSALIVSLWTALAVQGSRQLPSRAGDLQQRLFEISRRKASVQHNLRAVKKQERVVSAQLQAAEAHLRNARQQFQSVSHQLVVSEVKLQGAQRTLVSSEVKLNRHQEALGDRLALIYERGDTGLLETIFASSSYTDLMNRIYLFNQVMDQDANLLDNYEKARDNNAAATRTAADRKEEVAQLREQAAQTHAAAAQQRENTAALKQKISQQRAYWERALDELEQNSREVAAMLRRLQNTSAGRRRLAQYFNGNFLRPVPGEVTSGFGYRMHPILHRKKMHTGVDMHASYGTPIHAAASGTVIHAGRWGGYGNCVIIDHGGGVATLYGHCSSLLVTSGQDVRQGQVIARVGSTGLSTGPHLHFEVRRNGIPTNPGM